MEKNRRRHGADFKSKVALEALKEQKTLSQLSDQYEIHANQISDWKKHLLEGASSLFEKKRDKTQSDAETETAEYLAEIGRLQMELSFLKKKLHQLNR